MDMREARQAAVEQSKAMALERQRVELAGSLAEREALLEEQAKEERVELLSRQAGRRMMNTALSSGWEAWVELWQVQWLLSLPTPWI